MNPRIKRFFWSVMAGFTSLLLLGVSLLLCCTLDGCMTFDKAKGRYAKSVGDTTYTTVRTVVPRDSAVLRIVTDTTTVVHEIRQGRAHIIYQRTPQQTIVKADCDSVVVEKKVPVYITKQVWGVSPKYQTATYILIGLVVALLFVYFFNRSTKSHPAMELQLNRIDRTSTYTGGILSVQKGGKWVPICDTLEDPIRELGPNGEGKVWGNTCILAGRYLVQLTMSTRFKKVLPLLVGVLFFAGIRIHVGNWTKDTDGCILVGLKRTGNTLQSSVAAMKLLMDLLTQAQADKEEIFITIVNS